MTASVWAFAGLGYLLGSIPFGVIFSRLIAGRDPRTVGSGNIGATNALRTGGRLVGGLTLVADIAKGAVPAWLALAKGEQAWIVAAAGAYLGHLFPIWLRFRGGKGIATMFGVVAPWAPAIAALAFAVWLLVLKLVRYVSVASLAAAWLLPVLGWLFGASWQAIALLAGIAVLSTWRHRDNIARLARGEEPSVDADRRAREDELRRQQSSSIVQRGRAGR